LSNANGRVAAVLLDPATGTCATLVEQLAQAAAEDRNGVTKGVFRTPAYRRLRRNFRLNAAAIQRAAFAIEKLAQQKETKDS